MMQRTRPSVINLDHRQAEAAVQIYARAFDEIFSRASNLASRLGSLKLKVMPESGLDVAGLGQQVQGVIGLTSALQNNASAASTAASSHSVLVQAQAAFTDAIMRHSAVLSAQDISQTQYNDRLTAEVNLVGRAQNAYGALHTTLTDGGPYKAIGDQLEKHQSDLTLTVGRVQQLAGSYNSAAANIRAFADEQSGMGSIDHVTASASLNAGSNLTNSFAAAFTKSSKNAGDFADTMVSKVTEAAGKIAGKLVFKAVISEVIGDGSSGGGGDVGGGLGSMVGSVWGPIGSAVGKVIGSLLGGLFGGKVHHAAGSVTLGYDQPDALGLSNALIAHDPKGNMDVSALQSDLNETLLGVQKIIGALGGTISAYYNPAGHDFGYVGYNEDSKKWDVNVSDGKGGIDHVDSVDQSQLAAVVTRETLRYLVTQGATQGLTDTQKTIIQSSKFGGETDTKSIQEDLAFADTYDQILKLADGTAQYGAQLSKTQGELVNLDQQFASLTQQAQDLGLSTSQFAAAADNAQKTIAKNFSSDLQNQFDVSQGRGFLKSLREFAVQAEIQVNDLDTLFSRGALSDQQYAQDKAMADQVQAQQAYGALVNLTKGQLAQVVAAFKDDSSAFGQAVEDLAGKLLSGTAIISTTGLDTDVFEAKIMDPLTERLLNLSSGLDPSAKPENDAEILAMTRQNELASSLANAELNQAQRDQITLTYQQIWAYEDQADAAKKAQSAMADAVNTVARFGATIDDYINKSSVDQYSGKSPAEILQATKDQFAKQYALAQGGNADALNSITTYAQQYRQAISTYYGGGAQGSAASQAVLDQLSALVKTPNLGQSVANNTLRNQGDAGIYIGPNGEIYNNGKRIGFSQNPNAGTNIAGFDALAATWHNDISPDDYKRLASSRDQLLRGYTDSQLQAVSDKYYGGATVTGLQDFIAKLDGLDVNFLSNTDGGAGYGGKGNARAAGQSGTIDPVAKAVNDNAISITTSTDAIPKAVLALQGLLHGDLTDGGYGVAAYAHIAKDQLTNALIGKGGVTDTQWQIANTYFPILHNDLTATVGPALATIPALVQTIQAMVGQVASLQGQVNSLMAQLAQAQQAAADQASANAQAIVAETKKQTAVIDRQGLQAGGRSS